MESIDCFTPHQTCPIMLVSSFFPDRFHRHSFIQYYLSVICREQCGGRDESRKCVHHWTDDFWRHLARRTVARQLDSCNQRWPLVGTIWANTFGHRHRLWNIDETSYERWQTMVHGEYVDSLAQNHIFSLLLFTHMRYMYLCSPTPIVVLCISLCSTKTALFHDFYGDELFSSDLWINRWHSFVLLCQTMKCGTKFTQVFFIFDLYIHETVDNKWEFLQIRNPLADVEGRREFWKLHQFNSNFCLSLMCYSWMALSFHHHRPIDPPTRCRA